MDDTVYVVYTESLDDPQVDVSDIGRDSITVSFDWRCDDSVSVICVCAERYQADLRASQVRGFVAEVPFVAGDLHA
ncbi:hypothetical protein [Gordonibacter sp.]|uniref:hypothetical protein n=1 Tax=Gordonibacter sp. TaxID=1968902 RepID=UPI002FC903D8